MCIKHVTKSSYKKLVQVKLLGSYCNPKLRKLKQEDDGIGGQPGLQGEEALSHKK